MILQMWKKKIFTLDEIGIHETCTLETIQKTKNVNISRFNKDDNSITSSIGTRRAFINKESLIAHGSYGNLFEGKRMTDASIGIADSIILKEPRMHEMNLMHEAILQHIAYKVIYQIGIYWAIPQVHDVYWNENKICFSMDKIEGVSIVDFFKESETLDRDFYILVAQASLILWCLEHHLGLDHRDLKADNILIKRRPCIIFIRLGDHSWFLHSPFEVVLLDFGFACLGYREEGNRSILNLGDGVLPPMDPCPKDGRDIFHLLTSLLCIKHFSDKISKKVHDKIDSWLSVGQKSYGSLARRWSKENWTYLVTSQQNFSIPACCPENILRSLLPDLNGYLDCT